MVERMVAELLRHVKSAPLRRGFFFVHRLRALRVRAAIVVPSAACRPTMRQNPALLNKSTHHAPTRTLLGNSLTKDSSSFSSEPPFELRDAMF